ncbi:MAG: trigger factor [Chloroflexota bacterium]|nr:trigger factor [Chloroflexota bacterium]
MKITTEKTKTCEIAFTVEAEDNELNESLNEAYHSLVQRVSVPGFRKGKTPRSILEQHIGKNALLEKALERLIPRLYKEAIESEKVEPIDEPQIEIIDTEPVTFKAVVPLKPEVILGDYSSTKINYEPAELSEEKVKTVMEQIRKEQAILIPVDRPVQFGDLVTLDIEATVEDKPFLNHKDMLYEVNGESDLPLPGVAQNLVGAEKNNLRTFTIDVPVDYSVKEFAGKSYLFKITPTEIKERELPNLDDELAQSAGYDNLAAMKEKVTVTLKTQTERENRLELREKALDAVVELSEVHYPNILEDREIEGFIKDEARRFGFNEIEDYLKAANKTKEDYQEQLRPVARKRINRSLILDKIAEHEKVEIDAKEVDNKIEEMVENAEDKERARQILVLPQIKKSIEQSLYNESTLDRLVQTLTSSVEEKTKED